MKNENTKSDKMFKLLVDNAIDFLRHSLQDIERNPKHSIINFCAAIELFLKSRLMLEHWSLIEEEPKNAILERFINGGSKTVGMEDTIKRLKNIADLKISKDAEESFAELRNHRNRIVHFFHQNYTNKIDKIVVEKIVAEQCRGWFHLHRLLTGEWRNQFTEHLEEIEHLHNEVMRNHRGYLQAKFESIRADIEKGKKRGVIFIVCNFCEKEARKTNRIAESLMSTECLVCQTRTRTLFETCPQCEKTLEISDPSIGQCNNCEAEIDTEYLVEKYAPLKYEDKQINDDNRAYCPECAYTGQKSVVRIDSHWVCMACLSLHDRVEQCQYCSENVAGDMSDSYLFGCLFCEGLSGNQE
jgi:hypothetical protein